MDTPAPVRPDRLVTTDHGLLVDIGFDSPKNEFTVETVRPARDKMVSEVGSVRPEAQAYPVGLRDKSQTEEFLISQLLTQQRELDAYRTDALRCRTSNFDSKGFEPELIAFESEESHRVQQCGDGKFDSNRQDMKPDNVLYHDKQSVLLRTRDVHSTGPGIPTRGALWRDSSLPVVLIRGSKSAPTIRRYSPIVIANEDEEHSDEPVVLRHPNRQFTPAHQSRGPVMADANSLHQAYDSYDRDGNHGAYRQVLCVNELVDKSTASHAGPEDQKLCGPFESRTVDSKYSGNSVDPDVVETKTSRQPTQAQSRIQNARSAAAAVSPFENDRPPTKRDVMKPQTFDGREPIQSFLAHFDVCAEFNGWTNANKASWLKWSLKGRAQQILWDLSATQLENYDDLCRSLLQRFGSENQSEVYKIELRNRRRGPRETLSDLMQDIRRLMVLAYSATTSDIWESVAINAFLEALDDPELALEIRKRGPTTFDNAYRDALLLEGFYRASAKPENVKIKTQNVRSTSDASTEMRKEIDSLKCQLKQQEVRHSQQLLEHNNSLMQRMHDITTSNVQPNCFVTSQPTAGNQLTAGKRIVCFSCGVPGHRKRECPNSEILVRAPVQNSYVPNQIAANRGPRPDQVCFTCGQNTHFARNCPLKTSCSLLR